MTANWLPSVVPSMTRRSFGAVNQRGWDVLRDDDPGQLLEHLVLSELLARFSESRIHYWRDKQHHEVDFVLEVGRQRTLVAIECKSSAAKLDPAGLAAFRARYPRGTNLAVTLRDTEVGARRVGKVEVQMVPFFDLPAVLDALR
jgi:predicted AAA+ superfamily ATPase